MMEHVYQNRVSFTEMVNTVNRDLEQIAFVMSNLKGLVFPAIIMLW